MKKSIYVWTRMILIIGTFIAVSCNENNAKSSDEKRSDSKTGFSNNENNKAEIHSIPSSAQLQKAYDAIMAKAGTTDPEMLELYTGYSKLIVTSSGDNAYLIIQMVSPDDKNKIVEFNYSFPKGTITGPDPITVSSGRGQDEKFIEKYEELKPSLFKKSDIIAFEKLDGLYKAAIEKSKYKPEECYVERVDAEKGYNNELSHSITVKSTKSITATKTYYFNKEGVIIN